MKNLPSALRLLALPALALLGVSCGSKDEVAANPYAANPYYGPQTYGNAGQNDGGYVAPAPATAPAAPDYSGGYAAPPPAPLAPVAAAPSYGTSAGGAASHTVTSGDTLFSLSRRYGTTVPAIKSANGLSSDLIRIGQTLTIPM